MRNLLNSYKPVALYVTFETKEGYCRAFDLLKSKKISYSKIT